MKTDPSESVREKKKKKRCIWVNSNQERQEHHRPGQYHAMHTNSWMTDSIITWYSHKLGADTHFIRLLTIKAIYSSYQFYYIPCNAIFSIFFAYKNINSCSSPLKYFYITTCRSQAIPMAHCSVLLLCAEFSISKTWTHCFLLGIIDETHSYSDLSLLDSRFGSVWLLVLVTPHWLRKIAT